MPSTNFATLARRYSSYDCTDYLYMRECEPHRIIIGAIVIFVMFLVLMIIALLYIRHRRHKARNTQAQRQSSQRQKPNAFPGMYEAGPELRAPPPVYARFDPESGRRDV